MTTETVRTPTGFKNVNIPTSTGGGPSFTVGPAGSGAGFPTINDALAAGDAAFPSDPFVIFVYPGTYAEDVNITRSGVSIVGFADQSFMTLLDGDFTFTPTPDAALSVSDLVINGHFNFLGADRGQVWMESVSVQTGDASPAWNLTNTGVGSQILAEDARGVNTGTGPALFCDMAGSSEVRLWGGNAIMRNSDLDNVAVDINGSGGFVFLNGPGFGVDGQLVVRGTTGALVSNLQVRTNSVAPVIMDGTANSAGFPLNAISTTSLQALGGTAVAIDSTAPAGAYLSYFQCFNLGAAAGLNAGFNPAQVLNSSAFLIP